MGTRFTLMRQLGINGSTKPLTAMVIAFLITFTGFGVDQGRIEAKEEKVSTITLRLGHPESITHPSHLAMQRMAEIAAQKSDGRLKIQVFGSNQLGGQMELIRSLEVGTVDLAVVANPAMATFFPRIQVLDLPFVFKDAAAAEKILDTEIGQILIGDMAPKGIRGLAWGHYGWRQLENTKRPVAQPSDIKGLRIRIMESPLFTAMFKAVGAIPVPLEWGEVFTALQQGAIDGLEIPLVSVIANKYYEVTKFVSLTNHVYNAGPIMASKAKFDSLDPKLQQVLQESAKEAARYMRELCAQSEQSNLEILRKNNVVVTKVNQPAFQEKMQPVYTMYREKVGAELLEKLLKSQ